MSKKTWLFLLPFIIFLMVRQMNRLLAKEAVPAAPAARSTAAKKWQNLPEKAPD